MSFGNNFDRQKTIVVYNDGNPERGTLVDIGQLKLIIRNRIARAAGGKIEIVLAPRISDFSIGHLENFIRTEFPGQVEIRTERFRSLMDSVFDRECGPDEIPYSFTNGQRQDQKAFAGSPYAFA